MKRNLLVTVGLAAVLALGLTARLQVKEAEYTAHEWGTFTSIQGSDGEPIRWNPFVTSDLPGFVFDRNRPTHHDELLRSNVGNGNGVRERFPILTQVGASYP